MSTDPKPLDRELVDAAIEILLDRKGFDDWWGPGMPDDIGTENRSQIKRTMRARFRKILKDRTIPE